MLHNNAEICHFREQPGSMSLAIFGMGGAMVKAFLASQSRSVVQAILLLGDPVLARDEFPAFDALVNQAFLGVKTQFNL